jgi:hypothetical protein
MEYFNSIIDNVKWMGWEPWKITYSSHYFPKLYELAVELIKRDKVKCPPLLFFPLPLFLLTPLVFPSPWFSSLFVLLFFNILTSTLFLRFVPPLLFLLFFPLMA